jgi:hypothetical protein
LHNFKYKHLIHNQLRSYEKNDRYACVLNNFFPHYLDHLAPLCYYLDCPLLVDDPDIYALAQKYYPQIKTEFKKLNIFEIAKEYDLLIYTSARPPIEVKAMAQAAGISSLRVAYTPHGFSDKGALSKSLMNHEGQDIALIHGNEQLRHLKLYGIDKQVNATVMIGQPRKYFYEKHKRFYKKKLKGYKTKKKSILFAPTFEDGYSTSAFKHTNDVIQSLQKNYQLIIKLHPLLKRQNLVEVLRLEEKYNGHPNVHILCDSMPLVWPFIEHCDLYLGDYCSIGFEFAQSEKPLYLFNTSAASLLAPYATLIKNPATLSSALLGLPKRYNFNQMSQNIFSDTNPNDLKALLQKSLTNQA